MVRIPVLLSTLLIAGFMFFLLPGATAALPGGGVSIIFSCNVEGASVSINGNTMGTISGGQLEVPYEASYTSYTVSAYNYNDKSGPIPEPLLGATEIPISVTLTQKPIGSGKGWITVHCNTDSASVFFDNSYKGLISGGVLSVQVSTTGTPYTTVRVSKTGYYEYEGPINSMPSDGQTIDVYATLNPIPTPTTSPTTVPVPIGGDVGWYAIHSNVNGASVYFDGSYKGAITGGVLSVQVYTTGTPYSAYRVEKSGYVTATGSLPAVPSKGQTRDVYVTLSPLPTTAPILVGGDKGYYVVHCNVDGASVLFDNTYQGVIANGILTVQIATTGTPYRSYEVTKAGYITYTGSISQYPAKDQTVDLYATLSPAKTIAPTTIPTTVPVTTSTTYAPIPVGVIMSALLIAVCVFHRRDTRKK